MKRIFSIAMLFMSSTAFANETCTNGEAILKCYHPTARYIRCEDKKNEISTILFEGGITRKPYEMEAEIQRKGGFHRVQVLRDNAIFPPNRSCPLDNWQPDKP